jgi:toxin ParE1/3/4
VARYSYSAQAEEDSVEIWTDIAGDSLAAADRMLDRIEGACERLAENPHIAAARPDIAEGLRYTVIGRYLALYRIVSGGVRIIRVVHGARHPPDLFPEG